MKNTLAFLLIGLLAALTTSTKAQGPGKFSGLLHPTISTAYYDDAKGPLHKIGVHGIQDRILLNDLHFENEGEDVAARSAGDNQRLHLRDAEYMEVMRGDNSIGSKSFAKNDKLLPWNQILKAMEACELLFDGQTTPFTFYVGATENRFVTWRSKRAVTKPEFIRNYTEDKHDLANVKMMPIKFEERLGVDWHRFSAIDCDPLQKFVTIYDEAGFTRAYRLRLDNDQLTLIDFEENNSSLASVSPLNLSKNKINLKKEDNSTAINAIETKEPGGVERIRLHYNHSFIESITRPDIHTLCYSRGLRLPGRPLIHCINAHERNPKTRSGITTTRDNKATISELERMSKDIKHEKYSILAMEVVNTSLGAAAGNYEMFYHFVYLEFHNNDESGINYRFCRGDTKGKQLFNSDDGCEKHELRVAPIDLVHYKMDKCEALLAFYPQMYEVFKPNQSLVEDVSQRLMVVKWMNFVVNAVLHWEGKFYFFLAGNKLKIAKSKASQVCGSDSLKLSESTMTTALASEFLLQIGDKFAGLKYNSIGHTFTGHSVFNGEKWSDDIYNAEAFEFEDGELIKLGYAEDPGNGTEPEMTTEDPGDTTSSTEPPTISTTTAPGNGTGEPSKPGGGMSLVMIFICLFIVLGIISALIYYFFFSGPADDGRDMGLRKAKSAFRQHKSKRKSAQPLQSASSSAGPSLIGQHKTVRSAMSPGQKSTVKSAIKAQGSGSKLQSPGSKLKSPKSATKSPKSPKSATKSPGSGIKSPKSATKSPKSPKSPMSGAKASKSSPTK